MSIKKLIFGNNTDRMPDIAFLAMSLTYRIFPAHHPIEERVLQFGIQEGATLVDYGCGPARYIADFCRLVGENGTVYAADVQELALKSVRRKAKALGLTNVETALIDGYASGLDDRMADVICALDMLHMVREPDRLLRELRRIVKEDGVLVIDDGHQPRANTRRKIADAGCWTIVEETDDHLKCAPA